MSLVASPTRWSEKHRLIAEAATALFLRKGYLGTSMDDIAAEAAVSKQTVYKHFSDKDQLFAEIVLATTDQIEGLVRMVAAALDTTVDLRRDLSELARSFLITLMRPELLRLRRLVITTADQFPEIGRSWYEQGFRPRPRHPGRALRPVVRTWVPGRGRPAVGRSPFCRVVALDPHQPGHVHRRRDEHRSGAGGLRRRGGEHFPAGLRRRGHVHFATIGGPARSGTGAAATRPPQSLSELTHATPGQARLRIKASALIGWAVHRTAMCTSAASLGWALMLALIGSSTRNAHPVLGVMRRTPAVLGSGPA